MQRCHSYCFLVYEVEQVDAILGAICQCLVKMVWVELWSPERRRLINQKRIEWTGGSDWYCDRIWRKEPWYKHAWYWIWERKWPWSMDIIQGNENNNISLKYCWVKIRIVLIRELYCVGIKLCKYSCEKNILSHDWRCFNDYLLFKEGLALFFWANY